MDKRVLITRQHSSRIRTAPLPTVSHGIQGPSSEGGWGWGVSTPGHTHPIPWLYPPPGHTPQDGTWYQRYPPRKDMRPEMPTPPARGQTDACENITFPQLRLRATIIT